MVNEMPILTHYKQGLRIIVKTDFSTFISSRVLFQFVKYRLLYPVASFSKILNLTKCNYEIYDKELLAIIPCFK